MACECLGEGGVPGGALPHTCPALAEKRLSCRSDVWCGRREADGAFYNRTGRWRGPRSMAFCR
ncbi:hypothetical protein GCM10022207_44830 [Streptomyces lannensis]|uniref:Uncharacterized protein n=1 Tax=Streptomyces lannensis TaxID=766498 RepID=A0ABP7KDY8_9ACTN